MNAKQYRKERDQAREDSVYWQQECDNLRAEIRRHRDVAAKQMLRANRLDAELAATNDELTTVTHERNQAQDTLKSVRNLAFQRQNHIDELRVREDEYRAEIRRERDNPYYKNLVKECEDLRKINADNKGPVWTKRLHLLVQDDKYTALNLIHDTTVAQSQRIMELESKLAVSENTLRATTSQRDSLQNRLVCQIHNRRLREATIREQQRQLRGLGGQLIAALCDKERYKTLYFDNVPGWWEA